MPTNVLYCPFKIVINNSHKIMTKLVVKMKRLENKIAIVKCLPATLGEHFMP